MSKSSGTYLVGVCIISLLHVGCAQAQHVVKEEAVDSAEMMPLFERALGAYSYPVTTTVPEAQAYMDQGIQMMFSFAKGEAPQAFKAAQQMDPQCAMCAWGEAWSWGSYLNGRMSADDAPRAHAAIERARVLAGGTATRIEKALIEAMAVRYEPEHDADRRLQLDSLYAKTMAGLFKDYPDDLLIGTLYAEALMLLEPRRGMQDANDPDLKYVHEVLEHVLAQDISHPGACHLYIHATEATEVAGKAEACADVLGDAIPGASHMNHMPSHTYSQIGRWGDAVRANIQAWHSDLKAEVNEGFAIYPSHNLHMLLFAASMDGQGAVAIQAARDYGNLMKSGDFYLAMTLVRFGRFDEVLELDDIPVHPIMRGYWDFSKGYAHLKKGDLRKAKAYLDRVQHAAQTTPDSLTFRRHTADKLLGVLGGILEGEWLRKQGQPEKAIAVLEKTVALEDELAYDEPEPIIFSARSWLGSVFLEIGELPQAERVFREALEDHPNNGWDLYGLREALHAQGKHSEVETVQKQFQEAWARSDTWIRGPHF